ncbi:TIGR04219 family outer membrane beta-barrel protein [Vibrio coralliirubri]|uniref:TIGR04219 family outer membrane beta-barrel protein n=1 Tax=Vibrio coralliirubri TaxID=1516159 RepID=UPI00228522C6|nr:TIGR04219 family outer membrane beta-barrel protein [Vibrio coralliirubri]MCY9861416.1 TIGR04219 family outer membrane beta-barrel protein [Vibrio coralliirubri]
MRLNTLLAAIALIAAPLAQADELFKIHAEAGVFDPSEVTIGEIEAASDYNINAFVSFEHAIPLIPNARIDGINIESDKFDLSVASATAYYQFLDLDILSLDGGIGGTYVTEGVMADGKEFDAPMAHVFAEAAVAMPFFPSLSVYANMFKMVGVDAEGHDYKVGLRYSLDLTALDVSITGGFRQMSFDIDDASVETLSAQGMFLNLGVSI